MNRDFINKIVGGFYNRPVLDFTVQRYYHCVCGKHWSVEFSAKSPNYCSNCSLPVKDNFEEARKVFSEACRRRSKKEDELKEQFKLDALRYCGLHENSDKIFAYAEGQTDNKIDLVRVLEGLANMMVSHGITEVDGSE